MSLFSRAAAAALVSLATAPAAAHAVLERKEAAANAWYRGIVQITHGCDGAPTTRVSVTIPEGVVGAKPMPKPGWEVTTTRGPYAKTYPHYHGTVSEGVKTITWSGGSLPDDHVDEFIFFARISDAFAPGAAVYFPIQQDCAKGHHSWSEIPAPGQDGRGLKSPAPSLRITAAQFGPVEAAPVRSGDLIIRTPWLRATPTGAKVAGGYVTVTNAGREADTLIGASMALAGRGEIHSMSMENGIAKMAPVEGGLTIEPGTRVVLKPGDLHLMFLDLREAPKAGATVSGTLDFKRAGPVPVTFTIAPIGAVAPNDASASGRDGHGHH